MKQTLVSEISTWNVFKWILLFVVFISLKPWILWEFDNPLIISLIVLVSSFFAHVLFSFRIKNILLMIIFFLLARFGATRGNFNSFLATFLYSIPLIVFIGLKDKYKIEFLFFFTKTFSLILGISLIGWILYLVGVNLPHNSITYGYSEIRDEEQYFFDNYYFFLVNKGFSGMSDLFLTRFSSIFIEPGHISVVIVLLLHIHNYDFKNKYVIFLFCSLLFTFSLAGYLLCLFSFFAYLLQKSKKRIFGIIIFVFSIWCIQLFFTNYNDGNNLINQLIFERLKFDDNKFISGNNRDFEQVSDYFYMHFLKSNDFLMGFDIYKIFGDTSSVSWKVYLMRYGLLGLFLLLLFWIQVAKSYKCYESYIIMFLYMFIFVQTSHFVFWSIFPIIFISGCAHAKMKDKRIKRLLLTHEYS